MSSFEQRLISEIEFRLERSPVEESDDDVQHDQDSAGQGAAPSFTQKLKHYKVFEGMPVTFSCKVQGDPKPKVGPLSWTTREHHITVILKRLGQLSFLALGTQMCDADDWRCTFGARAACWDQERSSAPCVHFNVALEPKVVSPRRFTGSRTASRSPRGASTTGSAETPAGPALCTPWPLRWTTMVTTPSWPATLR